MTSANAEDTDPLVSATPPEIERAIAREFTKRPPLVEPAESAAVAMVVVGPVLEARDAAMRADERRRCAAFLRDAADALLADGGLGEPVPSVYLAAARLLDPLGAGPVGDAGEAAKGD